MAVVVPPEAAFTCALLNARTSSGSGGVVEAVRLKLLGEPRLAGPVAWSEIAHGALVMPISSAGAVMAIDADSAPENVKGTVAPPSSKHGPPGATLTVPDTLGAVGFARVTLIEVD
ncbi:MAG: hypothetical protein IPP91_09240 [Betaproteobacteria bacterium]|nr:hypothetical protein [Betaproteobacteria bacterium]